MKAISRRTFLINHPEQAAATYPAHNCYAWNNIHYVSTAEYRAATCGTCGKIVGFKWRSLLRRIGSLFTAEVPKIGGGE